MLRVIRFTIACALIGGLACGTDKGTTREGGRPAPDEPWRTIRPTAGPAPEFKLPVFLKSELKSNGLTVFVVEDHSLPTVTAAVVVRAGSAHETAKEAGLAALTYDMLDEGAGSMNQLALANAFSTLGTSVNAYAAREYGSVNVDLLKKHADAGLALLSDVVQKPTFAAADFERQKGLLVAAVKQREGDPGSIAQSLSDALIFGADHPYGHDDNGSAATLEKINAARAKKFWADNAGPKNAALVLIGDLTLEEATKLAEKHFGKWKGTAKAPKPPTDPAARTALSVALVDIAGAPSTVVRIGHALMPRNDPDEPALIVMNDVFGGNFTSRINLKLREEKQWTYGAFSFSDRRLGKGPYIVQSEIQTPNTVDAVAEILAQLEKMKEGVTDAELKLAKEGYVKSLPSFLGLPPVQANAAAALFAYNLPVEYYAQLVDKVKAVTLDDVKRVAARTAVKEDLVVVLVGDKAAIEPKLKEKALGEVTIFNRDGTPAK